MAKTDLYQLIKAMSRTEKRYFSIDAKKSGREGARYLRLFQYINEMEEWDNEKLKKRFKQNLSADKRYLYEAILKSMRDYRSAKSKAAQVKELLMDSEYLYERGLNNQSQARLLEAKALAMELQDNFMLLKISVDEQQFFVETKKRDATEILKELYQQREFASAKINIQQKYLDLYINLVLRVLQEFELKDEGNREKLKAEIPVELMEEANKPDSPRAQRRFLLCNVMYYRLLGETDKVYNYQKEVVDWWDNHQVLKYEEFHRYVVDVSNLVNSSYQSGKRLNEAQAYIEKLNLEKEGASYNGKRMVFQKVSISNLLYHLNQGDFKAAEAVLPNIIDGIEQFNLKKSIVLAANIITVYFILGQFQPCLEWSTHLIENIKIGRRKDIQRMVRIYKVICLFELDRYEEVESFRRSVQRFFRLEKLPKDSYEVTIHDFYLRKIINAPLSDVKGAFKDFYHYLNAIKLKVGKDTPLGLDELMIWVKKNL